MLVENGLLWDCESRRSAGPYPDGRRHTHLHTAGRAARLHQKLANHLSAHISQAEVTPFELEGELGVVEA